MICVSLGSTPSSAEAYKMATKKPPMHLRGAPKSSSSVTPIDHTTTTTVTAQDFHDAVNTPLPSTTIDYGDTVAMEVESLVDSFQTPVEKRDTYALSTELQGNDKKARTETKVATHGGKKRIVRDGAGGRW